MSDPWDVPPFPAKGDADIEHTFAGVGRVLKRFPADLNREGFTKRYG